MFTEPLIWWLVGFVVALVTIVLVVFSLDADPKPGGVFTRRLQQWRQGRTPPQAGGVTASVEMSQPPPRGSPAVVRLTLTRPQGVLSVIQCPINQLCERTLGRSSTLCDQVINATTVSRCHARLIWEPQKACWYVEDLGSKNGTFLDGAPLRPYTPAPLKEQTRLALGDLELTIALEPVAGDAVNVAG